MTETEKDTLIAFQHAALVASETAEQHRQSFGRDAKYLELNQPVEGLRQEAIAAHDKMMGEG